MIYLEATLTNYIHLKSNFANILSSLYLLSMTELMKISYFFLDNSIFIFSLNKIKRLTEKINLLSMVYKGEQYSETAYVECHSTIYTRSFLFNVI